MSKCCWNSYWPRVDDCWNAVSSLVAQRLFADVAAAAAVVGDRWLEPAAAVAAAIAAVGQQIHALVADYVISLRGATWHDDC